MSTTDKPEREEQEVSKPSILWMAVPILLIAVAVFLAR
jgi:hypothetical protein